MRTDHTRRSDRPIGGSATRPGDSPAVARRRSRPERHRLPPACRASASPSPRGLSRQSAAALWRIVPRWPSTTHVTTPTKHHPGPPLPQRRHHHPLRHPRHHTSPHARRPRRRLEPQSPHPSRQRGSSPPAHHRQRTDHPLHQISRPAHITIHAGAGRHPLTACHSPSSTRPSPATRSPPSTEPRSSSSNSTARITDQRLKHHAIHEAQRLRHILRSQSPG